MASDEDKMGAGKQRKALESPLKKHQSNAKDGSGEKKFKINYLAFSRFKPAHGDLLDKTELKKTHAEVMEKHHLIDKQI